MLKIFFKIIIYFINSIIYKEQKFINISSYNYNESYSFNSPRIIVPSVLAETIIGRLG